MVHRIVSSVDRVVDVRSGSLAAFVNVFRYDTNPNTETSTVNNVNMCELSLQSLKSFDFLRFVSCKR